MHLLTEDMFKSGRPVSQGEVNIWMKKYAPPEVLNKISGLKFTSEFTVDETGHFIVGHSETGAFHILEPKDKTEEISEVVQGLIDSANDTFMLLNFESDVVLTHLRSNDTHGGFILPPGEYIRGLREEQTVEGWRRVAD